MVCIVLSKKERRNVVVTVIHLVAESCFFFVCLFPHFDVHCNLQQMHDNMESIS